MNTTITGISSMATRLVLAELAAAAASATGIAARFESVGGVDAARRVQGGEPFDIVILAADAIDRLVAGGHVLAGSCVDLVRSPVAIAVPAGAPRPDVATESGVLAAVRAARRIGFSTGPSGVHLQRLFERWGLAAELEDRIHQAPPGVPVGRLVAAGDCDLGFQQLSELMHEPGIELIGVLPPGIEFITTFAAGCCRTSTRPETVRDWVAYAASPAADDAKRRHGMEPA